MIGTIVREKYEILEKIGEGGMACVYKALDVDLNREVAIKFVHDHLASNPDIRNRFVREGRTVAALDHPNILRIYDSSGPKSDKLYVVTEFVDGYPLNEIVGDGRSLNEVVIMMVAREVALGLEKASVEGVVHRDIKPENIMISNEGFIKIMDFGIAKDIFSVSATHTNALIGSPPYMSPEQISGKTLDCRTDIYSLGVMLYEAVTGQLPFMGNTVHEVIMKIMRDPYISPREIIPSLDPAIEQVINRCMVREIDDRYLNFLELLRDVEAVLRRYGVKDSRKELRIYFIAPESFERRMRENLESNEPKNIVTEVGEKDSINAASKTKRLDNALTAYGKENSNVKKTVAKQEEKKAPPKKIASQVKKKSVKTQAGSVKNVHVSTRVGTIKKSTIGTQENEKGSNNLVKYAALIALVLISAFAALYYSVPPGERSDIAGIGGLVEKMKFAAKSLGSEEIVEPAPAVKPTPKPAIDYFVEPEEEAAATVQPVNPVEQPPKRVEKVAKPSTKPRANRNKKISNYKKSNSKAHTPKVNKKLATYKPPSYGSSSKKAPTKLKPVVKPVVKKSNKKYPLTVRINLTPGIILINGKRYTEIVGAGMGKGSTKVWLKAGTHRVAVKKFGKIKDSATVRMPQHQGRTVDLRISH